MIKLRKLTASKFRIMLLLILSISIIASITVTYFGQMFIKDNSESVIQAVSTEFSSKNRLEQLQKAEAELKKHSESMEKAKKIASSSIGFAYQQQLIDDINRYAEKAGIMITGYSFSNGTPDQTASTPSAAGTPEPSTSGTPAAAPTGPVGMQKASVTVSFLSPIDYATLMRFLTILETSLPKINAQSIQINRSEGNPNEVNMSSLHLDVYITQ